MNTSDLEGLNDGPPDAEHVDDPVNEAGDENLPDSASPSTGDFA